MHAETICSELHAIVCGLPRNTFAPSEQRLGSNGLYFVFERSEGGHGGDRIVRVGSHTGAGNLFSRLKEHLTNNKDRSIFRKNIGRALLNRERDPFLESWNLDLTSRRNRERFAARVDMEKQRVVETTVSSYIQTNMSFSIIELQDSPTALALEKLCIGTVSRCSSCVASSSWLGAFSPLPRIRQSGLWQVQHLYTQPLSSDDVEVLRRQTDGL